jgi:hypothetical protein
LRENHQPRGTSDGVGQAVPDGSWKVKHVRHSLTY